MKTLSFDEACRDFPRLFERAATGETIVIERQAQRVALQPCPEAQMAPPNHFAADYSQEEIAELNALAAQAPQNPLP